MKTADAETLLTKKNLKKMNGVKPQQDYPSDPNETDEVSKVCVFIRNDDLRII